MTSIARKHNNHGFGKNLNNIIPLSDMGFTKIHRVNETSINNQSSSRKPPFLPRLPEKILTGRLNSSHLINDYYIDIDHNKVQDQKQRAKIKNSTSFAFKGDLLKASQVCLILEPTMSDSLKQIKTADTPWIRSFNDGQSTKPYKSSINKNRVEIANFFAKPRSSIDNIRRNSSCANRSNSSHMLERKNKTSSQLKLNSSPNELKSRMSNLAEYNSGKFQFAEDLLAEQIRKSFERKNEQMNSSRLPDVILHALDTVWELHKFVLNESPYMLEIFAEQSKLQTPEYKKLLQTSKAFVKINIGLDALEKMFFLVLEIDDPLVTKHCLAVALGSLYNPNSIEVPAKLIAGVLAIANILKFNSLVEATIDKISYSLNKKTIGDCYKTALKYNNRRVIEICESWLEINLIPHLTNSIYLKQLPLELLTRIIKSKKLFTTNEFENLIVILYWIFFYLNPNEEESPTESVIITYFSSLPKDVSLVDKYTEFKEVLYSIRLYGITKSNQISSIQQMNIYSHSHLVKTMMEIQQSLYHGGDMYISRVFETSAIRHGFKIDIEQNYYSEIFSLYGFHFELVAEKIDDFEGKSQTNRFQFYIQRLTTRDPVLTYEQSQLEMFSLRNDRLCTYSINVQYWHDGKQIFKSTGPKQQRFGKAKSQLSQTFEVDVPITFEEEEENDIKEIFVMYSMIFPVD